MISLREGLKSQANAVKFGFPASVVTSNQLINLYSKHGLTDDARKLFDEMPERNVFSWNTIINAYIKSRDFVKAKRLFDSSPRKDSVTYNSMISGYARSNGYEDEAIELFNRMQFENSSARIDEFTLTTMLNLVAKVKLLHYGRQVHSFMVKTGNNLSGFALSSLIDMYSKCGSFADAFKVVDVRKGGDFIDLVVKNALVAACCREGELESAREIFSINPELNDDVSWNTMISGYAQNGFESECIELFKRMADEGVRWNEHTFASLLIACAALKSLKLGKEVHARVLKEGMCSNPFISSGIVDIYSKCGDMRYAASLKETVPGIDKNLFAITSMIVGYSAKGDLSEARRLFDSLPEKNFVVWTAIISGYVKSHQCEEAFVLFREYIKETIVPDVAILVSMLTACAVRASSEPGRQIHAYLLRMGIETDEKSSSALIDMYSKCGFIVYARRVFSSVGSLKDLVVYNVMISGCAHHGFEYEAVSYFEEMTRNGIKPDSVTFIALLSACRHRGLVEAGEDHFLSMTRDYGIEPELDHYACMVDLYGRSNRLEKAVEFMEKMPFEADSIVLSAFLNACRENRNVKLARVAEKKLKEMEGGKNGGRYFQLASVYALGERWDEMRRVMRTMRGMEGKKLAGCSWVRVGNGVHVFMSGDRSHLEAEAVYCVLGCLIDELYGRAGVVDENHFLFF